MDKRIRDDTLLLSTTMKANTILKQMVLDLRPSPDYADVKLRTAQVEAVMLALVEAGVLEIDLWVRKE